MENNVVEQNKNKNVIIGLMACVIILLIAALVYFVFIKKDGSQQSVKPQDNQQVNNNEEKLFSKLEKIKLSSNNVETIVNQKNIKLKIYEDKLYIDDKNTNIEIMTTDEYDDKNNTYIPYVVVSDYFIAIFHSSPSYDELEKIIDENGNEIIIKGIINNEGEEYIPSLKLYLENGKIMGNYQWDDCEEIWENSKDKVDCNPINENYQLVYDGQIIKIIK